MHYPAVPGRYRIAFFASAVMLVVVLMTPLPLPAQRAVAEDSTFTGSYLQLRVTSTDDNPDTPVVEGALAGVKFFVSFSGGGSMPATTDSSGVLNLPPNGPLTVGSTMTVDFESAPDGYTVAPDVTFPVTLHGNGQPGDMASYTVRLLESGSNEPTAPATVPATPTDPPTATPDTPTPTPTDPPTSTPPQAPTATPTKTAIPATSTPTPTITPTAPATATNTVPPPTWTPTVPPTRTVRVTYLYAPGGGQPAQPLGGGQFVLKDEQCSTIHYGPATTNAGGLAEFTGVALGNYCVSMVQPAVGFFRSDDQRVSVIHSSLHSVTVQAMPDPDNLPTPSPTATRPLPVTATPTSLPPTPDASPTPPATTTREASPVTPTTTPEPTATPTRPAGNETPTMPPTASPGNEPSATATAPPRQRAPRGTTPAPTAPSTAPSATATPPSNSAPPGTASGRIRPPRPTEGTAPTVPTQPTATPSTSPTATRVASQPPVVRPPRARSDNSVTPPATVTPSPGQGAQPSPTEPGSAPVVRPPRSSYPAPPTPTAPTESTATLRAAVWICGDETRPDTVDFDPVPDIHVPVRDGCRLASGGEVTLRLRTTYGGATAFDRRTAVDAQGEVLFTFPAYEEGRMVELSVAEPPMPTTMLARLYPGDSDAVRITIYVTPDLASVADTVAVQESPNEQPLIAIGSASLLLSTTPVASATLSLVVGGLRRRLNSRGPLPPGSVE